MTTRALILIPSLPGMCTHPKLQLATDVTGQPIVPIAKGQAPDRLSRRAVNCQHTPRNLSEERSCLSHRGGSLKSRKLISLRYPPIGPLRPGTHYPHVTWAHLTKCRDNRNVRGVLHVRSRDVRSFDVTRAVGMWEAIYHWILWRRFALLSHCLRHVISRASTPLTFAAHISWGELTWHELMWREDSVSPA